MGIAWCDGAAGQMEAVELRSGGLPLVPDGEPWPACPRCAAPMLFRAQIPLAMTTVVGPGDERVLSLFECHAGRGSKACDGALALVATGACSPRPPPKRMPRVGALELPPTTLPAMHGGLLVPFDDGVPGAARATLPPLSSLTNAASGVRPCVRLRGLLGSAIDGHRDPLRCACGKPMRTVARLVAVPDAELPLAAAVAQLCLACGRAAYHRRAAT